MVEDIVNGRHFIQMVKTRDKETLETIVKKHTEEETRVFTDCWRSYDGLESEGLKHLSVNHKKQFVSFQTVVVDSVPYEEAFDEEVVDFVDEDSDDFTEETLGSMLVVETVKVHTNKIERAWREVKRGLANQPLKLLSRNIGVEMFRDNHLGANVPFATKRDLIIATIGKHQTKVKELLRSYFPIDLEEKLNSFWFLFVISNPIDILNFIN